MATGSLFSGRVDSSAGAERLREAGSSPSLSLDACCFGVVAAFLNAAENGDAKFFRREPKNVVRSRAGAGVMASGLCSVRSMSVPLFSVALVAVIVTGDCGLTVGVDVP